MPGRQTAKSRGSAQGRIEARPAALDVAQATETVGLQPLQLNQSRDGLLYVPAGYTSSQPAPLAVMFHGAGGQAQHGISLLQQLADAAGIIILAPVSRRETWDVIFGGYGPDIAFLNMALEQTFSRYTIDPGHIAVGGFSDGASYALSVGITNGDLFTHVIAFSPGFMAPAAQRGAPRIFISHGIHDQVLPIDPCSRRIVPQLEHAGYEVVYHEFDGPHTIPADIAKAGVTWFTK